MAKVERQCIVAARDRADYDDEAPPSNSRASTRTDHALTDRNIMSQQQVSLALWCIAACALLAAAQQPPAPAPAPAQPSSLLTMLSDVQPQLEKAQQYSKVISSLFSNSGPQQQPGQPPVLPPGSSSSSSSSSFFSSLTSGLPASPNADPNAASPAKLVEQLNTFLRSTQPQPVPNAQALQQQQPLQQLQPQPQQPSGLQSALGEFSSGVQRIVSSNPSLVSDVHSLYKSVSSRYASSTASPLAAAAAAAPAPAAPALPIPAPPAAATSPIAPPS